MNIIKLLFLCVLVIINIKCSQQHSETRNRKNKSLEAPSVNKTDNDSSLIVPVTNYYNDSAIESIVMVNIKTNLKEGIAKLYYENGQLKQEGMWRENKQEGLWHFFNEDGTISASVSFDNDNQNGPSIFYNHDGKVTEKSNWKDGKLHGIATEYYDNGRVKRITKWIKGVKISESKLAP